MVASAKNPRSSITRNNLRDAVYNQLPQISRDTARRVTDEVFEEIILALIENDKVKLRGFGVFKVQHKKERSGRNPKNGIDAVITERRSIKFLASPFLKARVNGDETNGLEEEVD